MFLAENNGFNFTYLFLAIVIGLLLGLILSGRKKIDKTKIQYLDLKEFMDTKRKGTLLDVRKKELFESGKIVGAKSFPKGSGDFSPRLDIPIFIYDENGKNAYGAAKKLVKSGAVMVYILKEGYQGYIQEKESKNAK